MYSAMGYLHACFFLCVVRDKQTDGIYQYKNEYRDRDDFSSLLLEAGAPSFTSLGKATVYIS